jgi:predicted nucleic acid-binding protein
LLSQPDKHKSSISVQRLQRFEAVVADPDHVFKEAPFTVEIVDAMCEVRRTDVPDMPDGIVAATAVYFGVPPVHRIELRWEAVRNDWPFPAR